VKGVLNNIIFVYTIVLKVWLIYSEWLQSCHPHSQALMMLIKSFFCSTESVR